LQHSQEKDPATLAKARPNTCQLCRRPVIWARLKVRGKEGGRAYKPFAVERCQPGKGTIALTTAMFLDGEAPIAELVTIGTSYRSHREHCTGTGVGSGRAFSQASTRKVR
jgi:hypothetical protein